MRKRGMRYNVTMNLKERLQSDLKQAMLAKDERRKRTLRLVLAAIKNAEVEKRAPLDDSAVLAVIQKEVKSRQETIEGAQQAGRDDLVAEAEAEMALLQAYLPQPLTLEEVEALAREAIAEVGATSPRDMGKVMKALMPRVRGRAEGGTVSQVVRRLLAG